MPKYEVTFRCIVTVDAKNTDKAIELAWLRENLDINGRYKYLNVKKIEVV